MSFGGFSTSGLKPNLGTSWSTSNTPGVPTQPVTQLATQAGTPQAISPPAQGGGLFGGQQQQNQPSTSLFGGLGQNQPQQQQQQPSTGLFGQPAQGAQTGTGTGLFGASQASTQPGQTGGGLFGGAQQPSNWNTSNPLLPKSAFGAGSPATQQPQSAGSSLFGQPQQPQQSTGSGLFGQPQQQPQQMGSSLFGQPQQSQQGAGMGSSLFGQPQQQQQQQQQPQQQQQQPQQQQSGLFGSLLGQPKPQPSFGFSTTQPSLALQPATPTGPPAFTKSTKYNDLPDNLKKVFEEIEGHIQGRVQISNELKQRKIGEEATKGQEHIRSVHKDLISAITILQSDVLAVRDLKAKVDQTVQDTIAATHIIDGFRNPQQHGAYLKNHASFPLEFFMRITDQIRRRLQWYKATIEQVERKLASTAQQAQYTPQAITTTLEAQHASFIALANKTAALDSEVQKLKSLYTQLWRQKTGSMRDPFYELDRGSGGEFGLESLYAK